MTNPTAAYALMKKIVTPLPSPTGCPACAKVKGYCQECADRRWLEYQRRGKLEGFISDGLIVPQSLQCTWSKAKARVGENAKQWDKAESLYRSANLWLCGPQGVGKSHLARTALVGLVMDHDKTVAEVSAYRLVKTVTRFDEGKGAVPRWKSAYGLLIDDLDKGQWTPPALAGLGDLMDYRHRNGYRTYITSNMTPANMLAAMKARAGDNGSLAAATLDRMKPIEVIEMTGKSLR